MDLKEQVKIFKVSVQGDNYYFCDDLTLEQKQKCEELGKIYRKDKEKYTIEKYIVELYCAYGIVLHEVKVSFCVGF